MSGIRLDWEAAKRRLEIMQAGLQDSATPSAEDLDRVYRQRAELLAQRVAEDDAGEAEKILVFEVGGTRFGVALRAVTEVISHPKISPVPGAPQDVAGLVQVRGEVRPVWNLLPVAGQTRQGPENAADQSQIVLLRHASRELGILIDRIEDIVAITGDRQPAAASGLAGSWMTVDFVTVLETGSLFEKLQDSTSL